MTAPPKEQAIDSARATSKTSVKEGERLQRFLSRAKVCSRRKAEEFIRAGRVTINDKVAQLGAKVIESDCVKVDGHLIAKPKSFDYFVLHKPCGYLSTRQDDRGRPTVMDIIDVAADIYLYPVGRLDLDSSGLILLTNDGELAQQLLHPSHEVSKLYRVRLNRSLSKGELRAFRDGIDVEGRKTVPARIKRLSGARNPFWYEIELREGRKRQIRLMVAQLGAKVLQLVRIRMGPLTLRGLVEGRYRSLTDEEVTALRAICSGKKKSKGRRKRRS